MKIRLHSIAITLAAYIAGHLSLAQARGGDVLVEVNGNGDMVVVGEDDSFEFIYVEAQVQEGRFVFFDPTAVTTFNGLSVLTVNNAIGDMEFDLGSGENILILDDGAADDFEVFGDLEITASGNQPTTIILDDADVDGQTTITTKNGPDAVVLVETDVEETNINTGNGDDLVLALGGTADFNSSTQIKAGKGNDAVLLDEAYFADDLKLTMGSGNDLAAIFYSGFFGTTVINGNGGFDSFGEVEDTSFIDVAMELKSIENPAADPSDLVDQAFLNPVSLEAFQLLFTFDLGD